VSGRSDKAALRGEPSYVWRAGQERRLKMICDAAPNLDVSARVLENGCGVGTYIDKLRGALRTPLVFGLEYDFERAAEAGKRHPPSLVVCAAGERLPFTSAIEPGGWAIECRITSEDPVNGFLPSSGRVEYLHVPAGPGVRWDGGIDAGTDVGLHYDPLLAKLIVWAPTRDAAIARMHRALLELTVHGLETSREFHVRVMEDEEFRRGDVDIQWLERRLPSLLGASVSDGELHDAAIAAALVADAERRAPESRAPATPAREDGAGSAWRRAALLDALRDPWLSS